MDEYEFAQVGEYGAGKFWAGVYFGVSSVLGAAYFWLEFIITPTLLDTVIETSADPPLQLISLTSRMFELTDIVFVAFLTTLFIAIYYSYQTEQIDRWWID